MLVYTNDDVIDDWWSCSKGIIKVKSIYKLKLNN